MSSGAYFKCQYPRFCANCGEELTDFKDFFGNLDNKEDWDYQIDYTCECGTKFIRLIENQNISRGVLSLIN